MQCPLHLLAAHEALDAAPGSKVGWRFCAGFSLRLVSQMIAFHLQVNRFSEPLTVLD